MRLGAGYGLVTRDGVDIASGRLERSPFSQPCQDGWLVANARSWKMAISYFLVQRRDADWPRGCGGRWNGPGKMPADTSLSRMLWLLSQFVLGAEIRGQCIREGERQSRHTDILEALGEEPAEKETGRKSLEMDAAWGETRAAAKGRRLCPRGRHTQGIARQSAPSAATSYAWRKPRQTSPLRGSGTGLVLPGERAGDGDSAHLSQPLLTDSLAETSI